MDKTTEIRHTVLMGMNTAEQTCLSSTEAVYAEPASTDARSSVALRSYQQDCVRMVRSELSRVRSTLFVLPTGTGKSVIIANLVANLPGRVLVIAHRWELLQQLRGHIGKSGELVDLEMAGNTSDGARVVVASIQTISKKKRLERFAPNTFSHVFVDEIHHATAASYRKVISYFETAKILGCTATPDRSDGVGLGAICESLAFEYKIHEAMTDGWVSRLTCRHVAIKSITLKDVGTSLGDLDLTDLDAVVRSRESLHGIAKACLDNCDTRPTLIFSTTVDTAKALVDTLNGYREGCARGVYGESAFEERTETFAAHARGDYQYLVNVGVACEGNDLPYVSCIVMARPTKSRALFTQMVGRGFRLSPGKADCLVLDLVGDSGRHKLAHPTDLFTGKYSADVIERVRKLDAPGDTMELLDNAEREEREQAKLARERRDAAERKRLTDFKADVKTSITTVELLGQLGQSPPSYLDDLRELPSPGQVKMLIKFGIPIPGDLTGPAAQAILRREFAREAKGLARYKQVMLLGRFGVDAVNLTRGDASRRIDQLKRNGWQRTV